MKSPRARQPSHLRFFPETFSIGKMRAAFALLPHHLRLARHQTLSVGLSCTRTALVHSQWKVLPNRMCATGPPQTDSAMQSVHDKIQSALSPTKLHVTPTYGDPNGSHVSIMVVSDQFEGLSLLKRHQTVYQAIWEELSVRFYALFGHCHSHLNPFLLRFLTSSYFFRIYVLFRHCHRAQFMLSTS